MLRYKIFIVSFVFFWGSISGQSLIQFQCKELANENAELLLPEGIGFNSEYSKFSLDNQGKAQIAINIPNDALYFLHSESRNLFLPIMLEHDKNIEVEIMDIKNYLLVKATKNSLTQQFVDFSIRKNTAFSKASALYQAQQFYTKTSDAFTWLNKEIIYQDNEIKQTEEQIKLKKNAVLSKYFWLQSFMEKQRNQVASASLANTINEIDFSDLDFYRTGLMRQVIDQQLLLLKALRNAKTTSEFDIETKNTIDRIIMGIESLPSNQQTAIIDYLTQYFQKNSQMDSEKYLGESVLRNLSCSVDGNTEVKMKQISELTLGKKVKDIDFINPSNSKWTKLSDIKANKIVILFWSSECYHCEDELPKLIKLYPKLKEMGIEIIGISLDTDNENYNKAIKDLPWVNVCDFKAIESSMVKDYYITSTPHLFLIDKDLQLLYKNQINITDALASFLVIK